MSHYRGFTLKPCLQYMSTIRHTAWALLCIVVVWCRSQIHKSHHAPVSYPTMHHSEQKRARFCSEWCILGYRTGALWGLWYWFIPFVSFKVTSLGMGQSYDCFSANEATLNYMSAKFKLIHIEEQRKHYKKTRHNKTVVTIHCFRLMIESLTWSSVIYLLPIITIWIFQHFTACWS